MAYFKKRDQERLQSIIKRLEGLGEKLQVHLPGPKRSLNDRDKAFLEAAARRWVFMRDIILRKYHGRFHHLPSDVKQEFREIAGVYKKAEEGVGDPTRATILAVVILTMGTGNTLEAPLAEAMENTARLIGV